MFDIQIEKLIAEKFRLPTAKHIDLHKALKYFAWLESPEGRLENFLDEISSRKRD